MQVTEVRQHTLFQRVKRLASHAVVKMTMSRDFRASGEGVGRSFFSWGGQKPAPGPLLALRGSKAIKVWTCMCDPYQQSDWMPPSSNHRMNNTQG